MTESESHQILKFACEFEAYNGETYTLRLLSKVDDITSQQKNIFELLDSIKNIVGIYEWGVDPVKKEVNETKNTMPDWWKPPHQKIDYLTVLFIRNYKQTISVDWDDIFA